MVCGIELTCEEILDILGVKFVDGSTTGYASKPRKYEISDLNLVLKSALPNVVKVNIIINDVRLKSKVTTNKTKKFTKPFFQHNIRFHSTTLRSFERSAKIYIQKNSGSF